MHLPAIRPHMSQLQFLHCTDLYRTPPGHRRPFHNSEHSLQPLVFARRRCRSQGLRSQVVLGTHSPQAGTNASTTSPRALSNSAANARSAHAIVRQEPATNKMCNQVTSASRLRLNAPLNSRRPTRPQAATALELIQAFQQRSVHITPNIVSYAVAALFRRLRSSGIVQPARWAENANSFLHARQQHLEGRGCLVAS